jgi:hypothetical protein
MAPLFSNSGMTLTSVSYMVSIVNIILIASTVVSHVVIIFLVNISQLLCDCFNLPAHSPHLLHLLSSTNQIPCVIIDCLPSICCHSFQSVSTLRYYWNYSWL